MSTGRSTIPAEFYDVTSKRLLIEPQPQYLHAKLIMGATNARLDTDRGISLPMQGRTILTPGAPYAQLADEQLQLSRDLSAEAITVIEDFSPGSQTPGHTIRMNRPVFASSTYTEASREVPAGSVISQTPVNIGSTQVPLTVKRWAGPFNPATAAVGPFSLSKFDASRSIHDMSKVLGLQFEQDFTSFVDFEGVTLFDRVDPNNILYAGTMAADTDAVVAGDNAFSFDLVLRAERRMDEGNVPVFPMTKRRMMIISPLQSQQLKSDPDWQRMSHQDPVMSALYSGTYVGSAANFDVYKSSTLSKPGNGNAGGSIPIHRAQAFGPGMVGVGPAGMPYITPHTNDNYGEDTLAIWLWYCAFGVLDGRFGYSLRSS